MRQLPAQIRSFRLFLISLPNVLFNYYEVLVCDKLLTRTSAWCLYHSFTYSRLVEGFARVCVCTSTSVETVFDWHMKLFWTEKSAQSWSRSCDTVSVVEVCVIKVFVLELREAKNCYFLFLVINNPNKGSKHSFYCEWIHNFNNCLEAERLPVFEVEKQLFD